MLSLLALIWGSSFILMKRGLMSFSDTQVAALRMFISYLLLLPSVIRRLPRIKKRHIKSLLIVGFLGNAIPAFLFTKAQTEVSSSMAGILNSLTPLFALLVGLLAYRVKFTWQNLLGVIIGLSGATGLILLKTGFEKGSQNLYPLLIVLATSLYAFSVNEIKEKLSDLDGVSIIAVALFFVGPFVGFYLFQTDFSDALESPGVVWSFICIFILAAFGSVIATILFNNLIQHTSALFAASTTYLIPVVAIFWGLLDNESIMLIQIPVIVIILLGIYLVNKKPKVS